MPLNPNHPSIHPDGSALTIPAATDTAVPGGSQMCAQVEADTDVVS